MEVPLGEAQERRGVAAGCRSSVKQLQEQYRDEFHDDQTLFYKRSRVMNKENHIDELRKKWRGIFDVGQGMDEIAPTYLAMLGMATSVNHLENFLKTLPPNAILTRSRLVSYVNLWREFFTGPAAQKLRRELEIWIVEESLFRKRPERPAADATLHYISRICEERDQRLAMDRYRPDETDPPVRILSHQEKKGRGYSYFLANLFEKTFGVTCYLADARNLIQVGFTVRQRQLTESLAFKLSGLPGYYINGYGGDTSGAMIEVTFDIPAEGLRQFIKPHGKNFIATRGFLPAVSEELRKVGVPVGDMCRGFAMRLTPPKID